MQLGDFPQAAQRPAPPELPQIKVDHDFGEFFIPLPNSGSHKIGRKITIIGLGLIRSRSHWGEQVNPDGSRSRSEICRSYDAIEGHPSWDTFNWAMSGFAQIEENRVLACSDCPFKARIGGETSPRCRSTWTIPVMRPGSETWNTLWVSKAIEYGKIYYMPFTASGISRLEKYLTPFRDNSRPLYEVLTAMSLRRVSKGDRMFTIPSFQAVGKTPSSGYEALSQLLAAARQALQPVQSADIMPLDVQMNVQPPTQPQG